MELTEGQLKILAETGHTLVTGGPGSGKTTVSILKAAQVAQQVLTQGQSVLFLSFARATVSRVVEAIEREQKVPLEVRRFIKVETYHSFFWRVLRAHGYLLGLPRRLTILTPPALAIALSQIRSSYPARRLTIEQKGARGRAEEKERHRLAWEEGRVCFDLFARYAGDILHGSERIRRLLATMYPVIILDEFQDTNTDQWRVVRALGACCRLIALADPDQRIYDWLGADPARLEHFREAFSPKHVDLSAENHRSAGTEIAMFGNDLLTGVFQQSAYSGIKISCFPSFESPAMAALVTTTYAARQRLISAGIRDWSLAVLVPTKRMTRSVSDAFRRPPAGMQAIRHTAVIELEAAILAAEVIAILLQPAAADLHLAKFVDSLCGFFQGRGGDEPTQGALQEAAGLRKAYEELMARKAAGRALRRNSVLLKTLAVYQQAREIQLIGEPDADWRAVRSVLEDGACKRLRDVAAEVRNVRVLERGTQLRQALSQDWRDNGGYFNALSIVRQAFVQEHFSTSGRPETGVVVMNMHKAKGKQFDEVIVFEGWPIRTTAGVYNADRIVRLNARGNIDSQARQNLRVSVTRARRHTTILTPKDDPCVLLR